MAKQVKTEKVVATEPKVAPVGILQLVDGAVPKFRKGSAREAYYLAMAKHVGKPITEVEAAIAKSPPSQPKKGKLAGQTEPFAGWLGWFVRGGYFTVATK